MVTGAFAPITVGRRTLIPALGQALRHEGYARLLRPLACLLITVRTFAVRDTVKEVFRATGTLRGGEGFLVAVLFDTDHDRVARALGMDLPTGGFNLLVGMKMAVLAPIGIFRLASALLAPLGDAIPGDGQD